MTTKRNPKQEGSNLFDCKPQTGPCPIGCNQCFFNRPGAFYTEVPNVTDCQVPVVLTFMSYYSQAPSVDEAEVGLPATECYVWKVRHINPYWCPTPAFMRKALERYNDNRLVSVCGSIDTPYCRACRNWESYYWQTIKRMKGE